jgi:hypothetical protein
VRPGGEAEVDAGIPTFVDGVHVRGGLAELEPPTDELIASLQDSASWGSQRRKCECDIVSRCRSLDLEIWFSGRD